MSDIVRLIFFCAGERRNTGIGKGKGVKRYGTVSIVKMKDSMDAALEQALTYMGGSGRMSGHGEMVSEANIYGREGIPNNTSRRGPDPVPHRHGRPEDLGPIDLRQCRRQDGHVLCKDMLSDMVRKYDIPLVNLNRSGLWISRRRPCA
jgi:hypothetical protein